MPRRHTPTALVLAGLTALAACQAGLPEAPAVPVVLAPAVKAPAVSALDPSSPEAAVEPVRAYYEAIDARDYRRVNGVAGATAAQPRWHLESADLQPAR